MSISHRPPLLRGHRPGRERHYTSMRKQQRSHVFWLVLCAAGMLLGLSLFQNQVRLLLWSARRANDALARSSRFYAGRTDLMDPAPRCCSDVGCLANDQGRYAVITSLRSNNYLPLVQLIVYAVPGELSPHVETIVRNISELRYWNDLYFPSQRQDGRFSLNWVKLRAWELEDEFDAVLLVDSDLTILGDLSHIFKLPTAFAAVPDQDPVAPAWWFGSLGKIQGGMLFLRPCRAVAQHMISMLQHNRLLHFEYEYAEQDFLDWYFKFDRWLLPLEYNSVLPISVGNKTQGGMIAKTIHFTKHKPYVRNPAVPQHWYLTCTPLPSNTGDVVDENEEEIVGKAYRGRRYGGNFGGLLGTAEDVGRAVGSALQHARPPVGGNVSATAPAPGVGVPAAQPEARVATGTVRVQVTIPGNTAGRAPANTSDDVLLQQRV